MVDDLPDEEEVRELVNNTELSDQEIREQLIRIGFENIDEVLNYFRLRPYQLSIPHMLGSPLGEIETVSETRWSNYLEYLREVAASKVMTHENKLNLFKNLQIRFYLTLETP